MRSGHLDGFVQVAQSVGEAVDNAQSLVCSCVVNSVPLIRRCDTFGNQQAPIATLLLPSRNCVAPILVKTAPLTSVSGAAQSLLFAACYVQGVAFAGGARRLALRQYFMQVYTGGYYFGRKFFRKNKKHLVWLLKTQKQIFVSDYDILFYIVSFYSSLTLFIGKN